MKNLSDNIQHLASKTIVVRCNFDVPLENDQVGDTTRIEDSLPTLRLLRDHQCRVVILAHAGRPDGEFKPEYSLKPIARVLEDLLEEPVVLGDFNWDISQITAPEGNIVLMENLRFWTGEEENDTAFSQKLASFGDAFVLEAFANCHRAHASVVGIPSFLPSYVGLSLAREMEVLEKIKNHPEKPFVVVIGGAKLETKEPLVKAFSNSADTILVGGKIASEAAKDKAILAMKNVRIANLTPDGKDITSESAEEFASIIMKAKTVIWNGTMGLFEDENHQEGTRIVAEAVNKTAAFTLVGGGDTEAALTELKLEDGIDYISTGGGAMLTYLSEGSLVGLEALKD